MKNLHPVNTKATQWLACLFVNHWPITQTHTHSGRCPCYVDSANSSSVWNNKRLASIAINASSGLEVPHIAQNSLLDTSLFMHLEAGLIWETKYYFTTSGCHSLSQWLHLEDLATSLQLNDNRNEASDLHRAAQASNQASKLALVPFSLTHQLNCRSYEHPCSSIPL